MIGAYVGFICITSMGLGFFSALIISMIFCAVLGVIIEKVAYKPLRNSSRISALITAIGISLLLEYVVMFFAKADVRAFPAVLPEKSRELFMGVKITDKQIILLVITIILMVLLQFIVRKTLMGKAMRAVSMDKDAAQLMGINVDRTISFTFILGSSLAGAAGVLVGAFYNSIDPFMGIMPGLKAFVAAVLGGIGIIPGALVGGFSIGVIETLISGYGNSLYRDAVAFAILILVLLIKPSGLFGKNIREKV